MSIFIFIFPLFQGPPGEPGEDGQPGIPGEMVHFKHKMEKQHNKLL